MMKKINTIMDFRMFHFRNIKVRKIGKIPLIKNILYVKVTRIDKIINDEAKMYFTYKMCSNGYDIEFTGDFILGSPKITNIKRVMIHYSEGRYVKENKGFHDNFNKQLLARCLNFLKIQFSHIKIDFISIIKKLNIKYKIIDAVIDGNNMELDMFS